MMDSKPTITDVKTIPAIATLTQTSTIASRLPTGQTSRATSTISPLYDLNNRISYTQEWPIITSTSYPGDNEFLYKNTVVIVDLVDNFDDMAQINLDNLNDNAITDVDITIERNIGTDVNYSLLPVNNAIFYYSKDTSLNFDLCKEHFPDVGLDSVEYLSQGDNFIYGGSYCVLTSEGRIAIVNYIDGSLKPIGTAYEENLSVNITVYNEIINY
jgi:hypothetical protein